MADCVNLTLAWASRSVVNKFLLVELQKKDSVVIKVSLLKAFKREALHVESRYHKEGVGDLRSVSTEDLHGLDLPSNPKAAPL